MSWVPIIIKMSTAQIIYEQYKILPKKVKNELIELINKDNDEYVQVSLPHLIEGLKELKLVLDGKAKARQVSELLKELGHD
jgi:hypothetical protein